MNNKPCDDNYACPLSEVNSELSEGLIDENINNSIVLHPKHDGVTMHGAKISCSSSFTSSISSGTDCDKELDKNSAIKVIIRARPLNEREIRENKPVVIQLLDNAIQIINPAYLNNPVYLDAIKRGNTRYAIKNVPFYLIPEGIEAAVKAGECRTFNYDRCFGYKSVNINSFESTFVQSDAITQPQMDCQQLIFDEVGKEMLKSVFQGFNCTILAYGQTGSGKTYTMVGEKTDIGKGLIPRVCEELFQLIHKRQLEAQVGTTSDEGDKSVGENDLNQTIYNVNVSYCEVYNEKVHDLLVTEPSQPVVPSMHHTRKLSLCIPTNMADDFNGGMTPQITEPPRRSLKVREHPLNGPFVEGLSSRIVTSYAEIADEMLMGEKLRTVASTLMNKQSSRSHAIFTIRFTQSTFDPNLQASNEKSSKISMIDLAGSERANVSGTSGERLKEGANINKSLTTLGRVISALSKNKAERVPYRDSMLTWLLKESLGGNAKTTLLAMISPSASSYDETMSTLRYAESAKKVINRAVVNEDRNAKIIRELREEIDALKKELAAATQQRKWTKGTNLSLPKNRETYINAHNSLPVSYSGIGTFKEQEAAQPLVTKLQKNIPSLLNCSKVIGNDEPLSISLVKGITVLVTSPSNDYTPSNTFEEQPRINSQSNYSSETSQEFSVESKVKSQIVIRRADGDQRTCRVEFECDILCTNTVNENVLNQSDNNLSNTLASNIASDGHYYYKVDIAVIDLESNIRLNGHLLRSGQKLRLHNGDKIILGDSLKLRAHIPICTAGTTQDMQCDQKWEINESSKVCIKYSQQLLGNADENTICCGKLILNNLDLATRQAANPEFMDYEQNQSMGNEALGTHINNLASDTSNNNDAEYKPNDEENHFGQMCYLETTDKRSSSSAQRDSDLQLYKISNRLSIGCKPDSLTREAERTDRYDHLPYNCEEDIRVTQKTLPKSSPNRVRMLGQGRIYFPTYFTNQQYSLGHSEVKELTAVIHDIYGKVIGRIFFNLHIIEGNAAGNECQILQSNQPKWIQFKSGRHFEYECSYFIINLMIRSIEFRHCFPVTESISVHIYKWIVSGANQNGHEASTLPNLKFLKCTEIMSATDIGRKFVVNQLYTATFSMENKYRCICVDIWGVGDVVYHIPKQLVSANTNTYDRLDVFMSADIEEREHDGMFRPVHVKRDGFLRLYTKTSRRVSVQISQTDNSTFKLGSILDVYLSGPLPAQGTDTVSITGGKTQQWQEGSSLYLEASDISQDCKNSWQKLISRFPSQTDLTKRQLEGSFQWPQGLVKEVANLDGQRTVYQIIVIFAIRNSTTPIVVFKTVSTKICNINVSTKRKWSRYLENSRISSRSQKCESRNYRLGSWYSIDLKAKNNAMEDNVVIPEFDNVTSSNNSPSESENGKALGVLSSEFASTAIKCLEVSKLVSIMEYLRQSLHIMLLSTSKNYGKFQEVPTHQLTYLLESIPESEGFRLIHPFKEKNYLQNELVFPNICMELGSGFVIDVSRNSFESIEEIPAEKLPLYDLSQSLVHDTHFMIEPIYSELGEGSEMCGYLYLSAIYQLDHDSAMKLINGIYCEEGQRSMFMQSKLKMSKWKRRWFVLKRPYFNAYEVSHSVKEQVGVLDVTMCKVFIEFHHQLPTAKLSKDIPSEFAISRSFCIICLVQNKWNAWVLHAQSLEEMQQWLAVLEPLRVESHKSLTKFNMATDNVPITA